jgi:Trp operon repressor
MKWIERIIRREGKAEPYFREHDVLMLMTLLEEKGRLSRREISNHLLIGEGSVRTLLKKLLEIGIVEITPRGVALSQKGEEMWKRVRKRLKIYRGLECGDLTLGKENVGILLKESSDLVTNGLEQRDAAVFSGGKGATTIVFKDGSAEIAGVDFEKEKMKGLVEKIDADDGDVLLIGTADDLKTAEKSAWAASYTIIKRWRDE